MTRSLLVLREHLDVLVVLANVFKFLCDFLLAVHVGPVELTIEFPLEEVLLLLRVVLELIVSGERSLLWLGSRGRVRHRLDALGRGACLELESTWEAIVKLQLVKLSFLQVGLQESLLFPSVLSLTGLFQLLFDSLLGQLFRPGVV